MKHEAFDHPKFTLAARDLGMPLIYFRGVMASIWHFAKTHYPDGNIGRDTNEEIGVRIGYPDDADRLIEVLVARKLIDADGDSGRLYIHNWHLHCEDFVRQTLRNRRMTFANGVKPYLPKATAQTAAASNGAAPASTENNREAQTPTEKHSRVIPGTGNREPGTKAEAETYNAGRATVPPPPPPASLSEPDPEEPGEREELFGVRLPKQHPDEIGDHGLTGAQRAAAIGITSRIARTPSSVPWNDWPVWKRLFADGLTPDAAHAAVERLIARETAAGNTPSTRLPYYVGALEDAAKAAPALTLERAVSIEDEEREWAERQKRLQVRKGLSPEVEAFLAKRALAAQGAAA